jgi:hypothetical protein
LNRYIGPAKLYNLEKYLNGVTFYAKVFYCKLMYFSFLRKILEGDYLYLKI